MYVYDQKSPLIQRTSQAYDYSNCVLGPQRYSRRGLGGVPGVRYGNVERPGGVVHKGNLADGTVRVRSNEVLLLEETSDGTRTGKTTVVPGFLALEYKGSQADMTKWLQFAWFEMTAKIPRVTDRAPFPGSLPSIGGSPRPLTTDTANPQWIVDSSSTSDPFYESSGGFANRSPRVITIFDRPGMLIERIVPTVFQQAKAKFGVEAESVTFAAHFDTYLIQNNVPVYHVSFVATITFNQAEQNLQKPPVYALEGTAGPIVMLPAHLRTILHSGYPSYTAIK
jgi:hypothetical protein